MIKMYVFEPLAHGPVTFCVIANREEDAREMVKKHMMNWDSERELHSKNPLWCGEYEGNETQEYWADRKYECRTFDVGEVFTNAND